MSNNINKILLIGLGQMAIDYAKILLSLNVPFIAIGRTENKISAFKTATGVEPITGGIENFLKNMPEDIQSAIVAVDVPQLCHVSSLLLNHGIKKILLEKPGGINYLEIETLTKLTIQQKAEIFIAYNRRFYSSVLKAKEIIEKDGGVKSFNFEFTEWSHQIEKIEKPIEIKEGWFLANSTHVVDLAFFLGGKPKEISSYQAGKLNWHSKGSIFAGAGISENGALFSYQANWAAPGRWGVEILTNKSRLILRPLEKLQIQEIGSVNIHEVPLNDEIDKQYKPGLYNQVKTFLSGKKEDGLLPLEDHAILVSTIYTKICH